MQRFSGVSIVLLLALAWLACADAGPSAEQLAEQAREAAIKSSEAFTNLANQTQKAAEEVLSGSEETIQRLPELLQGRATEYRTNLLSEHGRLADITKRLGKISPQDLLTGEGKQIKDEAEKIHANVADLNTKLQRILEQVDGYQTGT